MTRDERAEVSAAVAVAVFLALFATGLLWINDWSGYGPLAIIAGIIYGILGAVAFLAVLALVAATAYRLVRGK